MSTVGKAMAVLEAFDAARPHMGLTEIARATGFDKATARRLLLQLAEHGMIEHDEAMHRYRLGPALVRLSRIRETHFPFLEIARPFVQALAEETGETTHLSEFEGGLLNSTFVSESSRANRVSVSVGVRLPLHGTASGLAWLAHAPEAYVDHYLLQPLQAHTRFTPTDPVRIRDLLAETRERGYSIGIQGHEEGVYSTGAAIFGGDRTPVGAIAIACPLVRIDDAASNRLGQSVRMAAGEITARLAGRAASQVRPDGHSPHQNNSETTKAGA